jgi:hypothetical protein
LSAAADYLAAGRDLLHTHFIQDPAGVRAGTSFWAPVITSGPATAALLSELAGYLNMLSPWIAKQSGARRTAIEATTRITAALDDLAIAVDAPSSMLAAARRASRGAWRDQRRQQDQLPALRPHPVTPVPGRTEQALRKLQIRDPALLLRAAVIDQAARDLVAEARAKARSRDSVTGPGARSVPQLRDAPGPPVPVASQDVPRAPRPKQPVKNQPGTVMPGVSAGRARSALQRGIDSRRSADRR